MILTNPFKIVALMHSEKPYNNSLESFASLTGTLRRVAASRPSALRYVAEPVNGK